MTHAAVRDWLMKHTALEPELLEGVGFGALASERVACAAGGSEWAYVELLSRSPAEVERLVASIAVPETWLFRYPQSFELLAGRLRGLRESGVTAVRMASIGCATGQEPYGMAIAALHAGWDPERVSIEAWDRNPEVLAAAAAARYGPSSIRGEIPVWAAPYLLREDESICIDAKAKRMVRFHEADAAEWRAEQPLDVIFFRNLLIYLNAATRARLLRSIRESLTVGGLLFVGHAELMLGNEPPLRLLGAPQVFALEKVDTPERTAAEELSILAPPIRTKRATRNPATPNPAMGTSARHVDPEGTFDDARALADAGRTTESESLIRRLMSRQGPSGSVLELLGLIRMASHDVLGAKRLFEQAVYLEPARPAALFQLAMIHEREGDARGAAAYWDRARRASAAEERKA